MLNSIYLKMMLVPALSFAQAKTEVEADLLILNPPSTPVDNSQALEDDATIKTYLDALRESDAALWATNRRLPFDDLLALAKV